MKKILLLLIILVISSLSGYSQNTLSDTIPQPKQGKCLVYIMRPWLIAPIIGFKIFDGEHFIGNLKHNNYLSYECDPGEHIFIAKSENTDFLEADLQPDKVYVIYTEVHMGIVKAKVKMKPIHQNIKKYDKERKRFFKLLTNVKKGKEVEEIEDLGDDEDASPSKTMKNFNKKKEQNKKITQLTADMYFE